MHGIGLLSTVANTGALFLGGGVSANQSMRTLDLAAVGSVISRCCMCSPEPSLCAALSFVLHHCRYWSHQGLFCRLRPGKAADPFAAWPCAGGLLSAACSLAPECCFWQ